MLKEFFVNEYPHFLFKQWGLIHNIFTILALIGLVVLYINRNKLSRIKYKELILKIGAIILLLNMIIYTFGNLYYGSFNYKEMLPFHLCFIANYMFIIAILFNKQNILKYTLFMSFIGPIPAILWPELVSTIDNFNFWQLVISHHFFINISLFSYYALNYRIDFKTFLKTFVLINILLIIVTPFNYYFDTNYIFTNYIPYNVLVLYPWLKYFPPHLVLEVVGLLIAILFYNVIIKPRNKELDH
ncbi:MAG: TIGR02206 family membrane protein [Bacilli bacterium]